MVCCKGLTKYPLEEMIFLLTLRFQVERCTPPMYICFRYSRPFPLSLPLLLLGLGDAGESTKLGRGGISSLHISKPLKVNGDGGTCGGIFGVALTHWYHPKWTVAKDLVRKDGVGGICATMREEPVVTGAASSGNGECSERHRDASCRRCRRWNEDGVNGQISTLSTVL